MSSTHEMNLFDLCSALGRGVVRVVKALLSALAAMVRISYRYYWLVLVVLLLSVAAALYYSRPTNRIYRVDALAMINGATHEVVTQTYLQLADGNKCFARQNLHTLLGITPALAEKQSHFAVYNVFDCLADGTADMVDYASQLPLDDTTCVRMQDRLALQFYTKLPDSVSCMQEAILRYLNSQQMVRAPYMQYRSNLEREAKFHHDQIEKLDSLTSVYYFSQSLAPQLAIEQQSVVLGTPKVSLFLDDVLGEMSVLKQTDTRLSYADAPVVLLSPFVVSSTPINAPIKCSLLALLLGWVLSVLLALVIDRRAQLRLWLQE